MMKLAAEMHQIAAGML
uniref:Uncharacterized protein n=1 Tax=Ficus carica TaxID=3494 RepID=A0AA87Z777_FICCA|nr:hypothetical protein TIFTF001_048596 [Ficus carica]